MTAAAPLIDDGDVVGIIQVDRPVVFFVSEIAELRERYWRAVKYAFALTFVLSVFITIYVLHPVRVLRHAANELKGNIFLTVLSLKDGMNTVTYMKCLTVFFIICIRQR